MTNRKIPLDGHHGLRAASLLLVAMTLASLAGCGGSMGANPSSAGGSPPGSTSSSGGTPPSNPPAASAPTATAGNASGSIYSAITGTLAGSNPCNCGTPVFTLVSQPAHGNVTLTNAASGAFSYTPNPGYAGSDSFMFTFGNGKATSAGATETLTISSPAIGALRAPANIGTNLDGISYYTVTQPYVDMMRMAGDWESTSSDTVNGSGQELAHVGMLDSNGWPKEDATLMIMCCVASDGSSADPGTGSPLYGSYQLSFNGSAVLHTLSSSITNQQYDPATNTTTATLNVFPSMQDGAALNNVMIDFANSRRTATSAVNTGVTNVHLIRPQFAPNGMKWWDSPTQEFTDPFLASLAPFSTLRFMVWLDTNGSQVSDWDQRTPPDWIGPHPIETGTTWSNTGVSWQSVIDLANVTGKDIWINIPVRATDDYVTQLATLLKQELNPGIHVYVEYSNELWNYGFEQTSYNNTMTQQLLAGNSTAAANYQANCSNWAYDVCYAAERSMQISNDFAAVWGSPAIGAAIRPVFCNQEVQPLMAWGALRYINKVYGPPAKYFCGVCSAPYWGGTPTAGESVDDLLADSAASIPHWDGYLLEWTAAARFYGLHNFTYEGGTGMTDPNSLDTPNLIAANLDPRMGQQVAQALTGAFQDGLDMYMYFTSSSGWSKWGAWGATDDILDLTQPKWQALQKLAGESITRTLAVTAPNAASGVPGPGTPLPGTIDAGQPLFGVVAGAMRPLFESGLGSTAAANGLPDMESLSAGKLQGGGNSEAGYMVVASAAGTYTVTLDMDSRSAQSAATAQLYVNQQAAGGVISIPSSPKGIASQPASFDITLPAGISLIELEATSGTISVDSIGVSQ